MDDIRKALAAVYNQIKFLFTVPVDTLDDIGRKRLACLLRHHYKLIDDMHEFSVGCIVLYERALKDDREGYLHGKVQETINELTGVKRACEEILGRICQEYAPQCE